jgi:hypothetical protein
MREYNEAGFPAWEAEEMTAALRRCSVAVLASAVVLAASSAQAGGDSPVSVSDVKAEVKSEFVGPNKGKQYIKLSFKITANKAPEKLTNLKAKLDCKAGAETASQDLLAGSVRLTDLAAGDAKDTSGLFFKSAKTYLPATPERCEIAFTYGGVTQSKDRAAVGQFCFTGSEVKEGACAK